MLVRLRFSVSLKNITADWFVPKKAGTSVLFSYKNAFGDMTPPHWEKLRSFKVKLLQFKKPNPRVVKKENSAVWLHKITACFPGMSLEIVTFTRF